MKLEDPPKTYSPTSVPKPDHLVPCPPKWLRSQVRPNSSNFSVVDDHAIAVAQGNYKSFRYLTWNLYGRTNFSQFDKVRAIFRWISGRSMKDLSFNEGDKPGTPEAILTGFKDNKSTYAKIFQTLCSYAGVPCVLINGVAKGAECKPGSKVTQYHTGDKIEKPVYQHTWNAVYLDGSWQLVDCHWATRYLSTEKGTPENLKYEYDDYYFFTAPSQLIYSHLPDDSAWQLLKRTVPPNQFELLPVTKSHFFKTYMAFWSHLEGVLSSIDGYFKLSFGVNQPLTFTYKIIDADTAVDSYSNTPLARWVFQELCSDHVNYYVRCPYEGTFYLTVFVQRPSQSNNPKEQVFSAACEYKLLAERQADDPEPYPDCADSAWGSSPFADKYGLSTPENKGAYSTTDGHVVVPFEKEKPCKLIFRLNQPDIDPAKLENAMKTSDDDKRGVADINLPEKGEYGLEVYANDPNRDGHVFTHVGQYLLRYGDGNTRAPNYFSPVHHPYSSEPERCEVQSPVDQATTMGAEEAGFLPVEDAIQRTNAGPGIEAGMDQEYGGVSKAYGDKPGYDIVASKPASHDADTPDPYERSVPKTETVESLRRKFSIKPETYRTSLVANIAPQNFDLEPVDRSIQPKPVPPPSDGTDLGDEYEAHLEIFVGVDTHAKRTAQVQHDTFKDLIYDLIYFPHITNELEKVRAIFIYLCTKNLKAMNFKNVKPDSPEQLLIDLRDGRSTYSIVFETLCTYAGLHCTTISGYAKGVDYRPGMKFAEHDAQHSWNSVLVNGHWRLIDCHWAARRIVGKKTDENIQYTLDEYYFCTSPRQLVYSHFPHESAWQLLRRPLSLSEFEALPPVKPLFFRAKLEMLSHRRAIITTDGDLVIQIGFARYHGYDLEFSFTLTYEDGREKFHTTSLSQYGIHEIVGKIALFRMRLPEDGNYKLVLFTREVQPQETPQDKGMYSAVLEYKLVCDGQRGSVEPFPPCSGSQWGFSESANRYSIMPSDRQAIIHTNNGECDIQFNMNQHTLFMGKLKSASLGELQQHILQRTVNSVCVLNVSVPQPGEYGLEIFANNPAVDGKTLYHLCQYLIVCDEDSVSGLRYPQLTANYLGPQQSYPQLGVKLVSHPDPYVLTSNAEEHVVFKISRPVRMTSNLLDATTGKDSSEYVLQQLEGDQMQFLVRFPAPGVYKLQIFGVPSNTPGESIPAVFNFLLNCNADIGKEPILFPKQYQQWKDGCYLEEPQNGMLTPGKYNFKIAVPLAERVSVMIGEDWTHLDRTEDSFFSGHVSIDKKSRVVVLANFGGDESSFATLLEYYM